MKNKEEVIKSVSRARPLDPEGISPAGNNRRRVMAANWMSRFVRPTDLNEALGRLAFSG